VSTAACALDLVLRILLELAFFAVFAVVLLRYLRARAPLDRDVLAVFASVAALFALGWIGELIPGPDPLSTAAGVLLLAQPVLTLRLIAHFRTLPRALVVVVTLAFLGSAAWFVVGITGNRVAVIAVVAYFVIAELVAALYFVRAARTRAGTARARLLVAGGATFLFAAAVLVAGAGAVAASGGGNSSPAVTAVARLVALAAGLGYLAAFAPPRWIRRIQQQAIAFELNQRLLGVEPGTAPEVFWQQLADAARNVTGGSAALIVAAGPEGRLLATSGEWEGRPEVGSSLRHAVQSGTVGSTASADNDGVTGTIVTVERGNTLIRVPLIGSTGLRGELIVIVAGSPLFVDDDVDLLSTLASRTLTTIEREEALADRSALVASLRRTNEELARASAAKSDFLAAMSHELRTPLNSIIGFSELLMAPVDRTDGRRSIDVVDHAAHIHGAGVQLLDLINEVLDLARIEAGRLDLQYERFDVAALVRRTVDSMLPLADRKGIVPMVQAAGPVQIEADPGRVRQVVYNLLSNAIKFSPQGGAVRVTVSADAETARIAVEDEGPGIPAVEQGLVFEAFSQGALGRGQAEGAGLGLALSRQLAEAHGGAVELESEVGRGSRFTLALPLVRPQGDPVEADREGRRLVLIIEDDAGTVALVRTWLETEGYAVATALTGEEGVEAARRLVPDAILLDILLPGQDGWDVLQEMRLDRRTRAIPILVLSVVEDRQLGLALGAADYFVKPVDRDLLLERLGWAVRLRQAVEQPVVLAIDADASARRAYAAALDGSARLIEAEDGERGRRLAIDAGPDVILLDLGLHDISPFALLAELRAHPATRGIPILAVVSSPLDEADKARLTGQVVGVLEKRQVAEGLMSWLVHLPERRSTTTDDRSAEVART